MQHAGSRQREFIAFVLLFGVFRTAIADWNPIPSASMHPNLLEGDVVFVNRLAFDLKVPLTDVIVAHTGDPQARRHRDVLIARERHAADQARDRPPGRHDRDARQAALVNGVAADYDDLGLADEPLAPRGVKALHLEEDTAGQPPRNPVARAPRPARRLRTARRSRPITT